MLNCESFLNTLAHADKDTAESICDSYPLKEGHSNNVHEEPKKDSDAELL